MKRCLIFLAIIFVMIAPSVSAQTAVKKKVAVYMTGSDVQDSYKKVIGAKLVSAITATNEYAAVERTADFLAALSSEQDFQTSGEVQDSQIARLGQKFGVRYVVVTDVSDVFGELFVTARLINVESALVEKAFDVNAPAESMAQLIDLSNKVARGLLQRTVSSEPKHLALCASREGKIEYITADEWEYMKESDKVLYTKKGVSIMQNGELFIVSMRDSEMCYCHEAQSAPSERQLEIMYRNKNELNRALTLFGGEVIGNGKYWTNRYSRDSSTRESGYYVDMSDGTCGLMSYVDVAHYNDIIKQVIVSERYKLGVVNRPVFKADEL